MSDHTCQECGDPSVCCSERGYFCERCDDIDSLRVDLEMAEEEVARLKEELRSARLTLVARMK